MENKELDNTINYVNEVLEQLGDINMFCDSKSRTLYQKKLKKAYDKLFDLKKHLQFLKALEKKRNGI